MCQRLKGCTVTASPISNAIRLAELQRARKSARLGLDVGERRLGTVSLLSMTMSV